MGLKRKLLILSVICVISILSCDSTLLIQEKVNSVYYSSTSDLWIAADSGIYRIKNGKKESPKNEPDYIKGKQVRGIAEDGNKNIYFGVGGNIVKYDSAKEEWEVLKPKGMGRPDSFIQCLAMDKNNNLWIGRKNDLTAIYDGKNWKTYSIWNVEGIDFSGDGSVWLGTSDMGLYSIKNEVISEFNTNNSNFPGGRITGVLVDSYDNIWLSTDSGVIKFNHRLWVIYKKETGSLKDNQANAIELYKEGSLVIGMNSGVLQVLKNNKWKELPIGLKDTAINNILVNSDNSLLISTDKGLLVFK